MRGFLRCGWFPINVYCYVSVRVWSLVAIQFRIVKVNRVQRESEHWVGRRVHRMGIRCLGLIFMWGFLRYVGFPPYLSIQMSVRGLNSGWPSTSRFLGVKRVYQESETWIGSWLKRMWLCCVGLTCMFCFRRCVGVCTDLFRSNFSLGFAFFVFTCCHPVQDS